MKIKELFKEMEKANHFAEMVGNEEKYELEVAICEEEYFDWYFGKSFKSFKDFQKYCKEEYLKEFRDAFSDVEIAMGENGEGEGRFVIDFWWRKSQEKYIIKVHFWCKK